MDRKNGAVATGPHSRAKLKPLHSFWNDFQPSKRRDIRRLLPAFETTEAMNDERWARIDLLNKGSSQDQLLAATMMAYADDQPANITCCPLTTRRFRIWWVAEMLRLAERFQQLWFLTLVYPEESPPFGQLDKVDWNRIERRTRRRFDLVLPHPIWAMGGHEVHADYERKVWIVHDHLIVGGCTREEVKALRPRFFEDRNEWQRLMHIDIVTNQHAQFAYTTKFKDLRSPFERTGAERPKGFRLHLAEHNEYLRYLARHSPMDLVTVVGATRGNSLRFILNLNVSTVDCERRKGKKQERTAV